MISFAFSAGHVKSLSSSNRCAALVRRWSSMQATDAAKRRNADVEAAALIVGASRGIGLAISQVLPKRFKGKIFCACRNPDEAGALGALWQFNPERFTILKMDVTVEESVSEAATKRMPERNLSQVDADWMIENFKVGADSSPGAGLSPGTDGFLSIRRSLPDQRRWSGVGDEALHPVDDHLAKRRKSVFTTCHDLRPGWLDYRQPTGRMVLIQNIEGRTESAQPDQFA
uniref:Uncharacterized protein n=1 Tax=Rhodosorus marinus TaxID=101924 RepID=A0A7S3A3V0_9RHOD|mmetsp:Transcript_43771/g.171254  ORF Transcript_43771/g.171254 Transcript_43771/m.171254 type:complete len:229 (+) Transcript_43771:180-866(+)